MSSAAAAISRSRVPLRSRAVILLHYPAYRSYSNIYPRYGGSEVTGRTLRGKNGLLAGGAKNLGGLIARQAAEAGADVAIHYNSAASRGDAEETLAAVRAVGRNGV